MKTYVHIPFSIFSGNQNNDGYTDPSLVQLEFVRCEQGLMKRSTLSVFFAFGQFAWTVYFYAT